MKHLRPALVLTAILLALCSGAYPALVTVISQALFQDKAEGSVVSESGVVRGSSLLGVPLDHPENYPGYFWGRPSAASVDDATTVLVSGANNLGATSPALHDEVAARVAALRADTSKDAVPADLVTSSASGLDPHISPGAAQMQVARVAKARGLPPGDVESMVRENTEASTLGLLGAPRVNVLMLNLALERRAPLYAPAK